MKRKIPILLFLIALVGVGLLLTHSYNNFKVTENFTPIPLSFDSYSSTSVYDWNGVSRFSSRGFCEGDNARER